VSAAPMCPSVRTRPGRDDPDEIVYFKRHGDDFCEPLWLLASPVSRMTFEATFMPRTMPRRALGYVGR